VTGIIVSPFSPKEVKEAVLKLKNNPVVRKEMGKQAKELVLKNFTYSIMLDRMEKVYSIIGNYKKRKKR